MNTPTQPRHRRSRSTSRSGFTLIELLAVVAIIGVLVAILFPVIGMARESSASSRCVGNLRAMGVAIQSYTADNKGLLPAGGAWLSPRFDADPRNFQNSLLPYINVVKPKNWGASGQLYSSTFDCPGYKGDSSTAGRYEFKQLKDEQGNVMKDDKGKEIRPFGFVYQNLSSGAFEVSPKPQKLAAIPSRSAAIADRLQAVAPNTPPTDPNHSGGTNTLFFDWHVARVATN